MVTKEEVLVAMIDAAYRERTFTHWDKGAAWDAMSAGLRAAAELGWEMRSASIDAALRGLIAAHRGAQIALDGPVARAIKEGEAALAAPSLLDE